MATATKTKAKAKPAPKPKAKPKAKPVEQPVEESHVNLTSKKHQLQDYVATGRATIGTVLEQFGTSIGGLRSVAKQLRYGRWQVAGIKADSAPSNDSAADIALGQRLAKMKPSTAIKQLVAVPRRSQK